MLTRVGLSRVAPVIVSFLLAAACASPSSATPSATITTHSQGSPTPTIAASTTPSSLRSAPASAPPSEPSGSQTPGAPTDMGFRDSDILRVEVDGLAVREGPSRSSLLMQGERVVGVPIAEPTGDVRLNAGDFVSVHLGPLSIGDTIWYLVWPAEGGLLFHSTISWNTAASDGSGSSPGWVAASVGPDHYLSLHRRPDPSEYGSASPGGPTTLMTGGDGDYESGSQVRHDLFWINWVVVARDSSPCEFSMTLRPDGEAAPLVAIETTTSGLLQGPLTGPDSPDTPWGRSAGGDWETFTVTIESSCKWAIRLAPMAHD